MGWSTDILLEAQMKVQGIFSKVGYLPLITSDGSMMKFNDKFDTI